MDQPPIDASPRPRFDAGTFTTFPCRWTLGVAAEVARGGPFVDLTGAVHPTRDEAVVAATDGGGARVGARVSIAASGGVLAPLAPEPGRLFTSSTGYALQSPPEACAVDLFDGAFGALERFEWSVGSCHSTQSVVGRLESVSAGGGIWIVDGLGAVPTVESVGGTARVTGEVFAFREPTEDRTLVARLDDTRAIVERIPPIGAIERHELSRTASALSAAADPLRGGLMVHYRDAAGWHLDHFDWETGRWPEPHLDVSTLPEPAGPVATNETEILMPLSDGRVAYVPFALVTLMVRWVDPVDGGPVARMRVILRPGASAGGVLYENRGALWFQPLVCNR